MKVPTNWLADLVEGPLPGPEALAEALTRRGLEVDGVAPALAEQFSGVVIAEVTAVEQHPNADRLRVCEVTDGAETHSVICGAPNVRPGLRTAFAKLGAVLPGNFKIKKAKLRGVESNGMLCSAKELGLGEDAAGIIELGPDASVGADFGEVVGQDEAVLDIDLTPNRGDCFSILGVAREVTSILGHAPPAVAVNPVPAAVADTFPVNLAAGDACTTFAGRVVRGIDASKVSPLWLTERLRRAGVRAIHPVVDVTNYVMLELGQPLHGYDLSKLNEGIEVRWARSGEDIQLLDEQTITLEQDVLVIADGSGPVGLAGIMGGLSTAVDAQTTDVFFEAAFFAPKALAGRGRRWSLHTEASMRFERGVDPTGQQRAIERATELLIGITGGQPGDVVLARNDQPPEKEAVQLRSERLEAVLGMQLEAQAVVTALEGLGLAVAPEPNGWKVSVPGHRFDIECEEDLIEEVARVVGYDEIPPVRGAGAGVLGAAPDGQVPEHRAADWLAARGYREVMTYSFVSPEALDRLGLKGSWTVANPISVELSEMRPSLWPGLLEAALENRSRQQERLRLFEIGHVYERRDGEPLETVKIGGLALGARLPQTWAEKSADTDFFDVKADVELLLEGMALSSADLAFERCEHPALHPGQAATVKSDKNAIGALGRLHPKLAAAIGVREPIFLFELDARGLAGRGAPSARPVSRFPSLRRDLDLLVDEDLEAGMLTRAARDCAGPVLADAFVFDVYQGQGVDSGRKSIGLGLILQETSRTLTDQDADRQVSEIADHLRKKLNATIRI